MRKTKIICTIGPASENKLEEMINAGMNMARINFSHGGYAEQEEKINKFLQVRKKIEKPVAMLLDMQGPEIRTGMLEVGINEKVLLEDNQEFILVNEDIIGDSHKVSVSYKDLYKDVDEGTKILIDDGSIELIVNHIEGKDIYCKVIHGNKLGCRKTINIPGISLRLPSLKEKDIQDLKDAARIGFDYVAGSFIRNVEDVQAIRNVLDENGGEDIKLICKIENQEGIDNFEEILAKTDGIMVARGDLAVEIPFEKVPIIQKQFIRRCNEIGKIVIIATQMLESMQYNPLPTRAEVSDVANAIYDRAGCIMLSGESATGKYPVICVETMTKIANSVEESIRYWRRFNLNELDIDPADIEKNISYTTCVTAERTKSRAIISYTHTGNSIMRLVGMGPKCPIFAITDNRKTYNQLAIAWNVTPILIENEEPIEAVIEKGINIIKNNGWLEKGDIATLSGGNKILPNARDNKIIGGIVKI